MNQFFVPLIRQRRTAIDFQYTVAAPINNTREIRGYTAAGGRGNIKPGLLYRSNHLADLTDSGFDHLENLRLTSVYDLRFSAQKNDGRTLIPLEAAIQADMLPNKLNQYKLFNIGRQTDCPPDSEPGFPTWNKEKQIRKFVEFYIYLLEAYAPNFADVLRNISTVDNLPALIHCSEGRDRTGLAIALFLSLLEVSQDDIVLDYMLSKEAFTKAGEDIFIVPELITMTLSFLQMKYGGAFGFLEQRAGLKNHTVEQLMTIFVAA